MQNEVTTKADTLARKILRQAQNTVLLNMRFLSVALFRLEAVPSCEFGLATDGSVLYYSSKAVIDEYKKEPALSARNYLHIVLHCIFNHPFISPLIDREAWDFACDIAAEHAISELGIASLLCERQQHQSGIISKLKKEVKTLTADRIYHYLTSNPQKAASLYNSAQHFFADEHDPWYAVNVTLAPSVDTQWKDIASQVQLDLETFSKERGKQAGAMTLNLLEATREKYDYSTFLRRFAVLGEQVQVNDEEFDYIFYTYGMKLYEKMPLIEPLEYKDVMRIKEFIIAIDTSGSVYGKEVQAFLQKTYNILKQTESFFSKINLHIIQCDAEIQDVTIISSPDDIETYIRTKELKGFGGTDFRPVFRYVDAAIERGEFTNLRGLIYFTDGYGEYPKHPTPYNTAFVFIEYPQGEMLTPKVPVWAIKLVLEAGDI